MNVSNQKTTNPYTLIIIKLKHLIFMLEGGHNSAVELQQKRKIYFLCCFSFNKKKPKTTTTNLRVLYGKEERMYTRSIPTDAYNFNIKYTS